MGRRHDYFCGRRVGRIRVTRQFPTRAPRRVGRSNVSVARGVGLKWCSDFLSANL